MNVNPEVVKIVCAGKVEFVGTSLMTEMVHFVVAFPRSSN